MAAYKSTAPILNNRFIKVFWHTVEDQSSAINKETVHIVYFILLAYRLYFLNILFVFLILSWNLLIVSFS